ncbi:MAG: hypothetical protein QM398_07070 [Thermoproteota archaeon]|nr:hypothetical protein [Thermoproteota archaeon]NLD66308.1 hypothetical protein [Thermoproteota archaeon]
MNTINEYPRPGDLVFVNATDDVLIAVGSYGIIIGEVNDKEQQQTVSVVFNFTVPWWLKANGDSEVINASGGPQRGIRTALLKSSQKLRRQEFRCSENSTQVKQ